VNATIQPNGTSSRINATLSPDGVILGYTSHLRVSNLTIDASRAVSIEMYVKDFVENGKVLSILKGNLTLVDISVQNASLQVNYQG
jgi:hypothetical protein